MLIMKTFCPECKKKPTPDVELKEQQFIEVPKFWCVKCKSECVTEVFDD